MDLSGIPVIRSIEKGRKTMASKQEREVWLDYMKAIACLSVLTFHVIYGIQNAGLPCSAFFANIKILCGTFQIPVFMFASGYLYGKKPIKSYGMFWGRKLLNLGIPYVIFSAVYYFINVAFSSSVNFSYTPDQLIGIYQSPLAQYWYLFALLLLFIGVPVLEWVLQNEWMLLAFFIGWKVINTCWISITNYDYYFAQYALYFYMGTIYCRHHAQYSFKKEKKTGLVLAGIVFLALLFSPYFVEWEKYAQSYAIVEVFCAVISIYLLTSYFEKRGEKAGNWFLKAVSKYSFQIYLLHTMATAAVRILLVKVGITVDFVHVIVGIAVGLSVSWLVAFICEKSVVLNLFFFPEGTVKKIKKLRAEKKSQ